MRPLSQVLLLFALSVSVSSQDDKTSPQQIQVDGAQWLRAGPMLGYSQITETTIWLQTRVPAVAQVRFWKRGQPQTARLSDAFSTTPEADHIARFTLSGLEFGTRYDYEVYLNGHRAQLPYETTFQSQKMWRYRMPAPDFRVAIGSCLFVNDPAFDRPGAGYGSEFQILGTIAAQEPDLMIWLGDNVYLRDPDFGSRTTMRYRYAHARAFPGLQPLLAKVHQYAIWDDHDFGPNDSDRGYLDKDITLQAFRDYWANPSYGTKEIPGIFGKFQWGDVDFFLMDDRYHRSPNVMADGPEKTLWGDSQLRWLMDALLTSRAPFKVIATGTQVLNPIANDEGMAKFTFERDHLLAFIRANRIEGVLFLTGDRHQTELIKRHDAGMYPLYDFTSSPLTSGLSSRSQEAGNPARVSGTFVNTVRNFGLLDFSGARGDRLLTLRTLDSNGKELWKFALNEKDLKIPSPTEKPPAKKR